MGNVLIGWPNRVDVGTLSGGSWSISLDELQDSDIGNVARSTDTTTSSTKIQCDLGSTNYTLRAISLHAHNLSSAASIRFMLGTTSGGAETYDSTLDDAYTIAYDNDLDEFQGGDYTSIIHVLGAGYASRYVTIEIDDTANSDGYIEIGRLGIWSGFVPSCNMVWGASNGAVSKTLIDRAYSGHQLSEYRRAAQTARFSLDLLSDDEAAIVSGLKRRADLTNEVLYVPDVSNQITAQRYGFLGRLRELGNLERASFSRNTTEFSIEEITV